MQGHLHKAFESVSVSRQKILDHLENLNITPPAPLIEFWNSAELWLSEQDSSAVAAAVLTALALIMAWSRLGWGGRFSPFGRSGGSTQVSDSDYSYITSDDLRKAQERDSSPTPSGPPRDTDVLVLKSKHINYPVHFPAYSIEKSELSVGAVREQAVKKTGADPRRIKLFYKGKNLKEDGKSCRSERLHNGSEILCVIGDTVPESSSSGSEDERGALEGGETTKRKRNRNKNRKKKSKKPVGTSDDTPNDSSRTASPRPPQAPLTAMDKLNACSSTLQTLLPQCVQFTMNPPTEAGKKEYEHKRLSETVLAQVLLKLDAVETEGDAEARARRKELVREAQKVLNGLDDSMKS